MNHQIEIELVRKSSYGDQESFAILVRKYSNVVYGVAISILNDFHSAQDLAQEAFVKAWFNMDQLRDFEKFGSWLVRITRNLCTDRYRKKKITEKPLNEALNIPEEGSLEERVNRKADKEAADY